MTDVTPPLETSEPPVLEQEPDAAAVVFGTTIDRARSFTNELAARGEELGLIGPLELPRLWTRHILNSAIVAPLLQDGGRVGDVGSGAGLPGLVLAIARPDVRMVLIEPMERRVDWLRSEASRLALTNVEVVRGRAEDVSDSLVLDQVTARAVSALSRLIPITVPLVRDGGQLILMKGARVDAEVESARKVILRHHLSDVEVLELGAGVVEEITRVFRATVD
ncbi:16S rRNA (guanine(527)-N(7))-methyltransferase RsmG [Curtobacterium sp. Leaf261]|uniref:16S rRNA (guanine(527)-N(7))-methyltransferase RsmG n=1 Tax=Curtobacterium sp. Leaf261 TaxID=1736311 RepID=UPI000B0347AB|nr:16S rRNA (guanine(527)-N(7))-methyltransferase RsmG [Curtobacterium sp. Leaf261]